MHSHLFPVSLPNAEPVWGPPLTARVTLILKAASIFLAQESTHSANGNILHNLLLLILASIQDTAEDYRVF